MRLSGATQRGVRASEETQVLKAPGTLESRKAWGREKEKKAGRSYQDQQNQTHTHTQHPKVTLRCLFNLMSFFQWQKQPSVQLIFMGNL